MLLAAPTRSDWIALAKGGFVVPTGRTAVEMLTEMNQLLGSNDPVLRDDVAYSAAERWILRDRRLSPADLRALLRLWITNLDDGLGTVGDDRVFKRSFSALSLSVIAAADLSAPFLEPAEAQDFLRSDARLLRARARPPRIRSGAWMDAHRRPHLRRLEVPGAQSQAPRRHRRPPAGRGPRQDRVSRCGVHVGRKRSHGTGAAIGAAPTGRRRRRIDGVDAGLGGRAPGTLGEWTAGRSRAVLPGWRTPPR